MLGPSSGRSTGAAEHGPETPPYASSEYPESDEYGSEYWYDDEYADSNDDPYGYDDYHSAYPYDEYYEAYEQYEPETTEADNNVAEAEDQPEVEANDDASDLSDEYGYDREGFEEYSYDEYSYDEYEQYDYEADYWQDDEVTANPEDGQETADQADEPADSTDNAGADDNTEGYDEYGYDEYGYEYDGYDYYEEYEEYGYGSPQSTSTETPAEPAEDEVSDAETHQDADVVDQYGYWGEPIEAPEEELPLPPGPQEVTDRSEDSAEVADAQDESEPAQPEQELQYEEEYGYGDEYGYYGDEYGYYDEYGYDGYYDEYEQYNYGEEHGKYSREFDAEDSAAAENKADDSLADSPAETHEDAETYEDAESYDAYESYYDYEYGYGEEYGEESPYDTGAESDNDADQYEYEYEYEYGDEYGDEYDYDYCEYGDEYDYGDATESETAEPSYDTASTERGWYMDDLDPFTWLPRDLLQTADKELLRTLNVLYEEPRDVREVVLNEYIEGLGLDAVEFVARFEEAFDHQSLMLEDDLPGVAAILATYRMVEHGELGMDEGVEMLEQHFNHLSPEWIEDVSLIITELPPRSVRSEPAASESDAEVLEALLTASTNSVRSFGSQLLGVLDDVSTVPERLAAIVAGTGWTEQGTATVRDWIAR